MVKLRLTVTYDFEADPQNYAEESTPDKMAKIEEHNCSNEHDYLLDILNDAKDNDLLCLSVQVVED